MLKQRSAVSAQALYPLFSDDARRPYQQIADWVGCDGFTVSCAFSRKPYWTGPKIEEDRTLRACLAEASGHASRLADLLETFPEWQQRNAAQAGHFSVHGLRKLSAYLEYEAMQGPKIVRFSRRNLAAYDLAEGMRRLFRRLRKRITFGLTSDGAGNPSTEFGRAVEAGLEAFEIQADWKGPAEEAFKKQKSVEARLKRRRQVSSKSTSRST